MEILQGEFHLASYLLCHSLRDIAFTVGKVNPEGFFLFTMSQP